ncbi:uncharacterized [Tachysurus ichikawai]
MSLSRGLPTNRSKRQRYRTNATNKKHKVTPSQYRGAAKDHPPVSLRASYNSLPRFLEIPVIFMGLPGGEKLLSASVSIINPSAVT